MVSRRTTVIVMVAVAIVAIVAALYTPKLLHWGEDEYGDVTVQEASNIIADKPELVVLDVRTVSEANRLSELDKNDELLVYCRTGNRSATAVGILEDAGFTKIYHMHEGISVWVQQGYPVVQ